MRARSLSHLSNGALLSALDEAEARDRSGTVELLGYLAEVDRRRLYAPAGYPSMFEWCVRTRHYSEAMASRRIAAARAARRYPVIRDMIADGRMHLTAVALLSKRLTEQNADELLGAAVHKTRREIEIMLAERFPQRDVVTRVRSIPPANFPPSPVTVNFCAFPPEAGSLAGNTSAVASASSEAPVGDSRRAEALQASACGNNAASGLTASPSRIAPLAPKRFGVEFTMDEAMHGDLERALALLAPRGAEDRVREVFRRALRELVTKLEKQKFATTCRPKADAAKPNANPGRAEAQASSGLAPERAPHQEAGAREAPEDLRQEAEAHRPAPAPLPAQPRSSRYIPAHVRREVWARDQGRCTFVGAMGHRCESQEALEFDHVLPIARGGKPTTANLRLLCRAHNQYEAEQAFGEGFMHGIRERAARGANAGV